MMLATLAGSRRRAPPSGLVFSRPPEMSGIPREGESASIYVGDWPGANLYRITRFRDGAQLGAPITQAGTEYHFDWIAADAYTVPTATIEASANNGAAWTSPIEPNYVFYPDTNVIEPAKIAPDFDMVRTSLPGAALTFDFVGTLLPSYGLEIYVYDQDYLTLKYEGIKALTADECQPGASIMLDGSTGPSPDPAMPTPLATDIVVIRPVTQDWLETSNPADNAGKAGPYGAVSATDFGGARRWLLKVNSAVWGTDGGCVIDELELAALAGGPSIARRKNYLWSPGHYSEDQPGGDTFQSLHMFDNLPATIGALSNAVSLPGYIIVDLLIPRPVGELRIISGAGHALQAPGDIAFGPGNPNGTFIGAPPVTATGLTWNDSINDPKAFAVGAPASGGNFILRADGVSKILLADGASQLLRAA